MAAIAQAPMLGSQRESGWIYKPSWDLPVLIFSAALVPLPFFVAWLAQVTGWMKQQQAIDLINITVALLIGGPHLFSTVTYTFLDGNFRTRHKWYASLALVLPVIVLYLGVYYYTILITFFFTWASLHVLHQVIYLTDCYRARSTVVEEKWSKLVDYGLILTGMYPIGLYKLSLRQFLVGGVVLPYPRLRARAVSAVAGGDRLRSFPDRLDCQDGGRVPTRARECAEDAADRDHDDSIVLPAAGVESGCAVPGI